MKKRLLSVLLVFALLCTMLPQLAFFACATVYSGSCGAQDDNLTWTFDSESGLLTISGNGAMEDYSSYTQVPWLTFNINRVVVADGVTTIGNFAFEYCYNLREATIASSVMKIGIGSFHNCKRLEKIDLPIGLSFIDSGAFIACSGLLEIEIPASVEMIEDYAFAFCSALDDAVIPDNVKSLGSHAFEGCTNLKSIYLSKKLTILEDHIFCECSNLNHIDIPSNVTTIEKLAFYDCIELDQISIPDSVESIGESAFGNCKSLGEINLSNAVSTVGNRAFEGCISLKTVTIPSTLTSMGSGVFANCDNLQSAIFSEGCDEIPDKTFYECSSLNSVTIPESVTAIGNYALYGCSSLLGIDLPYGITSMNNNVFGECSGLLSIQIPNTVNLIGYQSFKGCSSLKKIELPESVNKIEAMAFMDCGVLDVYIFNRQCIIERGAITNPEKTTVYGYTNSTAQAYSQKYGFTFVALDGEPSGNLILSDEITHLIFSDLAYRHINREYVGRTVAEWQADIAQEIDEEIEKLNADPSYKPKLDHNSFNELNGQLYDSDSLRVIDALGMVGDWVIKEVIHGDNGYAAAVFQKGNDYIIAYRGSEGDPTNSISEGTDWAVDAKFALFNHLDPKQFSAALETYYKYADKGNVTLTGHSLGGALVTYVSILTGAKGYSFDGAAGHVVDLTYLFEPLRIDFSSKNNMTFSNYTDPPGASTLGADLIQHTNADLFPGVCYKTNPNAAKNGYPEFFWTHQRFSNTKLSEDGKAIEFMPVAETHSPKTKWYASVDYEYLGILEGAAVGALGGLPSGLAGGVIGAGVGRLVKKGNVILGDTGDDNLSVLSFIRNPLDYIAVVTRNVIYGGDGKDVLYGAAGSDVLAPGELKGDLLCGGLGNDDYILDCKSGGEVYISDSSGSDRIILNGVDTVYSFENEGSTADGKWEIYCANSVLRIYVQKTIFSHKFSIIDVSGASYGTVDSKRITTRGGETEAGAEKESKEILVLGDAQIVIYDESRTVVSEILTSDYGLRSEEYGTVYAANDGEQNYLSATIYENYSIEVIGDSVVDVQIVGTDSNGNAKKAIQAKGIDLQWADAEIDSAKQTVTQNGVSAVTCVTDKTVGVSIRQTLQELSVDETATLSATAFFEDGSQSTDVYWVSSDASVVRCDYDEGGECIISAVEVGNATIYAIASDSGCFASCELQVKSNTLVPCDGGENCPGNVFTDMPPKGNWAHDAIDWAIVNNITAGTSATTFSPNVGCTRAQVVTFLWRAKGQPEPTKTENPFRDVNEGAYYYKAVLWAVENGITNGTFATTFGPDNYCTRAQVVTFLWRTEGKPEPTSPDNPFTDVTDGYYYTAVLWAVEQKVTAGTSATAFSPNKKCTRGEIVTFLYRALAG